MFTPTVKSTGQWLIVLFWILSFSKVFYHQKKSYFIRELKKLKRIYIQTQTLFEIHMHSLKVLQMFWHALYHALLGENTLFKIDKTCTAYKFITHGGLLTMKC